MWMWLFLVVYSGSETAVVKLSRRIQQFMTNCMRPIPIVWGHMQKVLRKNSALWDGQVKCKTTTGVRELLVYWWYTHTAIGTGSPSNHMEGCEGKVDSLVRYLMEASSRNIFLPQFNILFLFDSRFYIYHAHLVTHQMIQCWPWVTVTDGPSVWAECLLSELWLDHKHQHIFLTSHQSSKSSPCNLDIPILCISLYKWQGSWFRTCRVDAYA